MRAEYADHREGVIVGVGLGLGLAIGLGLVLGIGGSDTKGSSHSRCGPNLPHIERSPHLGYLVGVNTGSIYLGTGCS